MNPYRTGAKPYNPNPTFDPRWPVPNTPDLTTTLRQVWPDVKFIQVRRLDGSVSLTIVLEGEERFVDLGPDNISQWVGLISEEVGRLRTVVALRSAPPFAGRFRRLAR